MKYIVCTIIISLFFVGCNKSKKINHNHNVTGIKSKEHLHEALARFTEIPDTPVEFYVTDIIQDERAFDQSVNKVRIVYALCKNSIMSVSDIQKYYKKEMDLLGWQLLADYCTTQQHILLFQKPNGVHCNIVIQQSGIFEIILL